MDGPASPGKADLAKSASNQSASKATNNKRNKKKNQRKKSNVSSSSATSSSAPATANKPAAKTDLPSPKVIQPAQTKAPEEKNKSESPKPKSSNPAGKATAASPQSGNKVSQKSEPKCQIAASHPKAKVDSVVESEVKSSEDKSSSSIASEVVRCDAIEVATSNQTDSPAAPSSDKPSSSEPQSPVLEDLPCELTKQCSDSNLANDASTDQSMDDLDSKGKPNGKLFSQNGTGESMCKICSKHVYHMEQIKAVKCVFHKVCFRCKECNKQLNVDSYSSHEGIIYCKPHFKQLFQPKAVFANDNSSPKPTARKYELIICENTPQELPADVVRSSAKQDDVFENINLDLSNIRNRFEKGSDQSDSKRSNDKPITRSESIHKIMQKYQSRVSGDKEITSSSEEEDNISESKPEESKSEKVAFSGMSALKSQWESGTIKANSKSETRVEDELAELRQKVKTSEPLKHAYERAVQEAKSVENLASKPDGIVVDSSVKAVSIKEKFEKGKVESETEEDRVERLRKQHKEEICRITESETCTKEARNKFKKMEANMGEEQVSNGTNGQIEDSISSNELQQRIKNFENLKDSQPTNAKESSGDEIDANVDDIPKADTTKKMLDKFKALEAGQANGQTNGAPKSPIRITPPRETAKVFESEPATERDPNIVRSSYKTEDDIQVEPEKAKNLRAKFENWQTEIEREGRKSENEEEYVPHIDTTKNLRAMFESIKEEYKPIEKARPRINRFVDNKAPAGEVCYVCNSRLYPMEKMEFSGIKIHKNCFRCNKCHSPLRLDNFTVQAEKLFCIPHFKQLFMEKGNYDEGFGMEQHKDKWSNKAPTTVAATNGKTNGVEKLNGDSELMAKEEVEETATVITTTNGNGTMHHDEEEEEDHHVPHQDEEPQSIETEEEEPLHKYIDDHSEHDDHIDIVEQLEHHVTHLELDEVLDGPIVVDNQA